MYFFVIPYADKQWASDYKKFNEANIYGRVEKLGIKNHGTSFKIKNDLNEYVFYPYTNIKLNDSKPFDEFVKDGDSMMKPAFSEILVVFKNGKAYEYRFKKK